MESGGPPDTIMDIVQLDSLVYGYLGRRNYATTAKTLLQESEALRSSAISNDAYILNDRLYNKPLEEILTLFARYGRFDVAPEMLEFGERLRGMLCAVTDLTNDFANMTAYSSLQQQNTFGDVQRQMSRSQSVSSSQRGRSTSAGRPRSYVNRALNRDPTVRDYALSQYDQGASLATNGNGGAATNHGDGFGMGAHSSFQHLASAVSGASAMSAPAVLQNQGDFVLPQVINAPSQCAGMNRVQEQQQKQREESTTTEQRPATSGIPDQGSYYTQQQYNSSPPVEPQMSVSSQPVQQEQQEQQQTASNRNRNDALESSGQMRLTPLKEPSRRRKPETAHRRSDMVVQGLVNMVTNAMPHDQPLNAEASASMLSNIEGNPDLYALDRMINNYTYYQHNGEMDVIEPFTLALEDYEMHTGDDDQPPPMNLLDSYLHSNDPQELPITPLRPVNVANTTESANVEEQHQPLQLPKILDAIDASLNTPSKLTVPEVGETVTVLSSKSPDVSPIAKKNNKEDVPTVAPRRKSVDSQPEADVKDAPIITKKKSEVVPEKSKKELDSNRNRDTKNKKTSTEVATSSSSSAKKPELTDSAARKAKERAEAKKSGGASEDRGKDEGPPVLRRMEPVSKKDKSPTQHIPRKPVAERQREEEAVGKHQPAVAPVKPRRRSPSKAEARKPSPPREEQQPQKVQKQIPSVVIRRKVHAKAVIAESSSHSSQVSSSSESSSGSSSSGSSSGSESDSDSSSSSEGENDERQTSKRKVTPPRKERSEKKKAEKVARRKTSSPMEAEVAAPTPPPARQAEDPAALERPSSRDSDVSRPTPPQVAKKSMLFLQHQQQQQQHDNTLDSTSPSHSTAAETADVSTAEEGEMRDSGEEEREDEPAMVAALAVPAVDQSRRSSIEGMEDCVTADELEATPSPPEQQQKKDAKPTADVLPLATSTPIQADEVPLRPLMKRIPRLSQRPPSFEEEERRRANDMDVEKNIFDLFGDGCSPPGNSGEDGRRSPAISGERPPSRGAHIRKRNSSETTDDGEYISPNKPSEHQQRPPSREDRRHLDRSRTERRSRSRERAEYAKPQNPSKAERKDREKDQRRDAHRDEEHRRGRESGRDGARRSSPESSTSARRAQEGSRPSDRSHGRDHAERRTSPVPLMSLAMRGGNGGGGRRNESGSRKKSPERRAQSYRLGVPADMARPERPDSRDSQNSQRSSDRSDREQRHKEPSSAKDTRRREEKHNTSASQDRSSRDTNATSANRLSEENEPKDKPVGGIEGRRRAMSMATTKGAPPIKPKDISERQRKMREEEEEKMRSIFEEEKRKSTTTSTTAAVPNKLNPPRKPSMSMQPPLKKEVTAKHAFGSAALKQKGIAIRLKPSVSSSNINAASNGSGAVDIFDTISGSMTNIRKKEETRPSSDDDEVNPTAYVPAGPQSSQLSYTPTAITPSVKTREKENVRERTPGPSKENAREKTPGPSTVGGGSGRGGSGGSSGGVSSVKLVFGRPSPYEPNLIPYTGKSASVGVKFEGAFTQHRKRLEAESAEGQPRSSSTPRSHESRPLQSSQQQQQRASEQRVASKKRHVPYDPADANNRNSESSHSETSIAEPPPPKQVRLEPSKISGILDRLDYSNSSDSEQ